MIAVLQSGIIYAQAGLVTCGLVKRKSVEGFQKISFSRIENNAEIFFIREIWKRARYLTSLSRYQPSLRINNPRL